MSSSSLHSAHSTESGDTKIISRDLDNSPKNMRVISGSETPFRKDLSAQHEKMDLSRKNLSECPDLQDAVYLKCLDLQNNLISRIDNLYTLRNLIFLDLYNNQIEVRIYSC